MKRQNFIITPVFMGIIISVLAGNSVFAVAMPNSGQTPQVLPMNGGNGPVQSRQPGVVGTVTKIENTVITIKDMKDTIYIINTVNATVKKGAVPTEGVKPSENIIPISDISVGDNLMIQGEISDTSIVAKEIMVGDFTAKLVNGKNDRNKERSADKIATSTFKKTELKQLNKDKFPTSAKDEVATSTKTKIEHNQLQNSTTTIKIPPSKISNLVKVVWGQLLKLFKFK